MQEYVRDFDIDNETEQVFLNQHEWKRKKKRLEAVNCEWMKIFFKYIMGGKNKMNLKDQEKDLRKEIKRVLAEIAEKVNDKKVNNQGDADDLAFILTELEQL